MHRLITGIIVVIIQLLLLMRGGLRGRNHREVHRRSIVGLLLVLGRILLRLLLERLLVLLVLVHIRVRRAWMLSVILSIVMISMLSTVMALVLLSLMLLSLMVLCLIVLLTGVLRVDLREMRGGLLVMLLLLVMLDGISPGVVAARRTKGRSQVHGSGALGRIGGVVALRLDDRGRHRVYGRHHR